MAAIPASVSSVSLVAIRAHTRDATVGNDKASDPQQRSSDVDKQEPDKVPGGAERRHEQPGSGGQRQQGGGGQTQQGAKPGKHGGRQHSGGQDSH